MNDHWSAENRAADLCQGDGNLHYADLCEIHFPQNHLGSVDKRGARPPLHFVTFANSSFTPSLRRIERQARSTGTFSSILIQSESDLTESYFRDFETLFEEPSRGYGFWSWKPDVILRALAPLSEGEMLLYADAGCHLNRFGLSRLDDYIEWLQTAGNDVLAFQYRPMSPMPSDFPSEKIQALLDAAYTKREVQSFLERRWAKEIRLKGSSVAAGIILIQKSRGSVEFFEEWRELMAADPSLLTDAFSERLQSAEFIEPRHDQSLFSLLLKERGGETVSAYETWVPKSSVGKTDWRPLRNYPLLAKRDLKPATFSRRWLQKKRAQIGSAVDSVAAKFRTPR
jgi:hypothetical protein